MLEIYFEKDGGFCGITLRRPYKEVDYNKTQLVYPDNPEQFRAMVSQAVAEILQWPRELMIGRKPMQSPSPE